jgi:ankyrin repeat protein
MSQIIDCVLVSAEPYTELDRRDRSIEECRQFCMDADIFATHLMRLGFRDDELPRPLVHIYRATELVIRTEPLDDIVDFLIEIKWSQTVMEETVAALEAIGADAHARFLAAVHRHLMSVHYDASSLDLDEINNVIAEEIENHFADDFLEQRYGDLDADDRKWQSICFHGAKYMERWTNIKRVPRGPFNEAELGDVVARADANARGVHSATALVRATLNGRMELMQDLLATGADVNAKTNDGVTALFAASRESRLNMVRVLIAANADVNATTANGSTTLMGAAMSGDPEVVRELLAAKADVNAKTNNGTTALNGASQEGHLEVVRALLAAGADVNATAVDGATALMIASRGGHSEVAQALLAAGADVDARKDKGETALITASRWVRADVVRALLAAGADANARRGDGETALIAACTSHLDWSFLGGAKAPAATESERLEVARVLLAAGADPSARTVDGATALSVASKNGHRELWLFLNALFPSSRD